MGSRDFRSTKSNIYTASVSDDSGSGIEVFSNGKQAVRTWLSENKTVSFLIADYNIGGADHFTAGYYKNERMPLKKGSILTGEVTLKIME